MTTKKKDNIKERYHGPLITDGVSLGYIKLYPWVSLPFSIFFLTIGLLGWYDDPSGIIRGLFLFCVSVNVISIIYAFFNSLVEKFQSLTYILIALVALSILIWLDFIGLVMFIAKNKVINSEDLASPVVFFYIIPLLLIFISATLLYIWYYLPKNQGKRWKFNDVGKDKKWSENFWITFGAVVLIPPFLTGHVANTFGVLAGVLFTVTLPAVIVDALYAAIYVKKHPEAEHLE